MPMYRVIHYGVITNHEGGYEVNDAHRTGQIIELPEDATDKQILKQVQTSGYIPYHRINDVEIDTDSCGQIYVNGTKPRVDRGYRPIVCLAPYED
jgi:hypothetical protein